MMMIVGEGTSDTRVCVAGDENQSSDVRRRSRNELKLNSINKNIYMAKRSTGVGKNKRSRSHKTKKRLEIKRLMLEAKAKKRKKK